MTTYLKIGDIAAAIKICVYLNEWNTAIELAESHKFNEIEHLLAKYATYLLGQKRDFEAIELYRKANYCKKSAHLLFAMAETAIAQGASPITIKQLYVFAALETDKYQKSSGVGASNVRAIYLGYRRIAKRR